MLQDETSPRELHIQLFPDSEGSFLFSPVEQSIEQDSLIRIGRKIDRNKEDARESDRIAGNVSVDISHLCSSGKKRFENCITFRSKVVSRHHAELWLAKDGQLYFKDTGSSSGTFVNRTRLSPTGLESCPYPLMSGDIIQLGVDYQGRQEEIYRAVVIKVIISKRGAIVHANKQRLNRAVRALLSAMNPLNEEESETTTDCCICLNSLSPSRALFLAPCSHCFHYKCVSSLIGSTFMFSCPLCRQVANLDACIQDEEPLNDFGEISFEEEMVDSGRAVNIPARLQPTNPTPLNTLVIDWGSSNDRPVSGESTRLGSAIQSLKLLSESSGDDLATAQCLEGLSLYLKSVLSSDQLERFVSSLK